ncbi:hypothetical protein TSOC_002612 [Tetrabaena socialis]|uniref:Uncharacterized protein n=1 Tax=Tetrabaena socialis TaxID=47790 RepID=A0A2J8ADM9_9CHLO|nr:hypothetical protein TSOC_002612 [Tetrabaena socialis]|eukprot:PNH10630.1 hypothetical protein TSOC_002612 [Tetrabaena socialis]
MPLSFVLDTAAPRHMYLCTAALKALEAHELLHEDSDLDLQYVKLFGRSCPVAHNSANILGLKMLKRLGLQPFEDEPHFCFKEVMPFLHSDGGGASEDPGPISRAHVRLVEAPPGLQQCV